MDARSQLVVLPRCDGSYGVPASRPEAGSRLLSCWHLRVDSMQGISLVSVVWLRIGACWTAVCHDERPVSLAFRFLRCAATWVEHPLALTYAYPFDLVGESTPEMATEGGSGLIAKLAAQSFCRLLLGLLQPTSRRLCDAGLSL